MTHPIDMLFADNIIREMQEDHKSIVLARRYHEGDQDVYLDARLMEFLGLHEINPFRLNICKTVVNALKDELTVIGFDTNEPEVQDGKKAQAQWASEMWKANRLDSKQADVHEAILRDRETFIIVDWDSATKQARFTHQLRFTDTDIVGGTGEGCFMVYENGDPNQPARAAVKQWVETVDTGRNEIAFRARRTIYYADRIEKWYYDMGWKELEIEGEPWPLPWFDKKKKPLGIPVIHFRNAGLRPEAWEAIPMQDSINKVLLDILATSDISGFPLMKALGFYPTTDGQPVEEDGSNLLPIRPGTWVGSSKSKTEADVDKIPGSDISPMMATLKDLIVLTAQITDTPVSRFVASGQVAGSETLKEQEKPLKKKAVNRRVSTGDSWEDVMGMARRLTNFFGNEKMDETIRFETLWDHGDTLDELQEYKEFNVPDETIWRRLGFKEREIEEMKKTESYRLTLELKLWEAAEKAVGSGVPLETFLRRQGWTDKELNEFGTQKLAAIKLKQEDRIPQTEQ